MKLQQCINFALTQAQSVVHMKFKANLNSLDVTPVQYALLHCLWDEDELLPSQLAQQTGMDASTITGILTRMEAKGFIERRHNMEDRRSVIVCLLPRGRDLQPKVETVIKESNKQVLTGFTDQEQVQFKEFLNRVVKLNTNS